MGRILPDPHPTCFIEYNTYRFNPKTRSVVSIRPVPDSSNRIETAYAYNIRVYSLIYPRSPIPGNIEDLNQVVDPIGSNYVTTDKEVSYIRNKLMEQSKTFRYIGQGSGDIYVNTIHPTSGKFVPDLSFGPKTSILSLKPVGANGAWKLEWEINFHIYGDYYSIDFNNPGKRIQEFNYTVNYAIDRNGMTRRTVSGRLKIVPPIYHGKVPTFPQGEVIADINTDNLLITNQSVYDPYLLESGLNTADVGTDLYKLSQRFFTASVVPQYITAYLFPDYAQLLLDLLALDGTYRANETTRAIAANTRNVIIYSAYFNNLTSYKNSTVEEALAKIPEIVQPYLGVDPAFFTANPALVYGPFACDNSGNVATYETVDQYRLYVFNSIILPKGFRRESQNYTIGEDKRTMSFTIVDTEVPNFSLVPGYSDVKLKMDALSSAAGTKWGVRFSGQFTFAKYTWTPTNETVKRMGPAGGGKYVGGLAKSYAGNLNPVSSQETTDIWRNYNKNVVNKAVALQDFIRWVNQRMAWCWAYNSFGKIDFWNNIKTLLNTTLKGFVPQTLSNSVGLTPPKWTISEEVTGLSISFTCEYEITVNVAAFCNLLSVGLPCILAADIQDTQTYSDLLTAIQSKTPNVDVLVLIQAALRYNFSRYTEINTHINWMKSQRFSSMCAFGSGNLVFNRAYDKIIDIYDNDNNVFNTIPKHGHYPIEGASTFFNPIYLFESGEDIKLTIPFTAPYRFTDEQNIEVFLEDTFGYELGQDLISNVILCDSILSSEVKLDNNNSYDTVENFVEIEVPEIISLPSPDNSWLNYWCSIETNVDKRKVMYVHTPLTKNDLSPKTPIPDDTSTLLEHGYTSTYNYGPDILMGEDFNNGEYTLNPNLLTSHIFQYTGTPPVKVILEGKARRINFPVSAPCLIAYGNFRAHMVERDFKQGMTTSSTGEIYHATWKIEYLLENVPTGVLTTPTNAMSVFMNKDMNPNPNLLEVFELI